MPETVVLRRYFYTDVRGFHILVIKLLLVSREPGFKCEDDS